jgi:outer membrane protein OmpA-like peptidoglycan-associated protein
MSKSNASAKNRRAFGGNPPPPPVPVPYHNQQQQQQQPQSQGLTIQQVIAVIDNRLLNLENFMKQSKEDESNHVHFESDNSKLQPTFYNSIN